MEMSRSPRFSRFRWLRVSAVALALLGQSGMVGASLNLAKDESSAISHTERSGIDLHHSHNEATCAACIALSLQGTPRAAIELPLAHLANPQVSTAEPRDVSAQVVFSNQSRAPPTIL
jgi:hypothetical protein